MNLSQGLRTLVLSAFLAVTLAGCNSSGTVSGNSLLPELPSEFETCFKNKVKRPANGALDKGAILRLITDLKKSEEAKSACGKRLIKFYEGIKARYK